MRQPQVIFYSELSITIFWKWEKHQVCCAYALWWRKRGLWKAAL